MENYQLRLMQEQDIDAVRALFQRVYGYARTKQEDVWRCLKTESGIAPIMLAEQNGTLVGSYATWPVHIHCGEKIIRGAQALDIMVDPAHAGKGLFTLMGEALFRALEKQGIQMLYGFPNPPSYVGHTRKMSWHHVADIPRYVRFIHPLNRFAFIPQPLRRLLHMPLDMLKPKQRDNYSIVAEKPAAPEAIVAMTAFPKYSCRIARDGNWFKWRYDAESGLPHIWLSAKQNGETKAFAIFREEKTQRGESFIRISELWGEAQAMEALVRHIVRHAYEKDCMLVMMLTNILPMQKTLLRHLFIRLQKKPYIVRPLVTESLPANIHMAENWFIMSGDFDAM